MSTDRKHGAGAPETAAPRSTDASQETPAVNPATVSRTENPPAANAAAAAMAERHAAPEADAVDAAPEPLIRARPLALVDTARARLQDLLVAPGHGVEAIHDFRVALRRLRSALRPLALIYPRGFAKRAGASLRSIADLTGELRDEEVLRETLTELDLPGIRPTLSTWMQGRARREEGIRGRVHKRLLERRGYIEAELETVRARFLEGPESTMSDAEFAASALRQAIDKIAHRARHASAEDISSMHRIRIAAKLTRYTAELIDGMAGIEAKKPMKLATRLQKNYGRLHDLDEALLRMGRAWGLEPRARRQVLDVLGDERDALAQRLIGDLESDVSALQATAARATASLELPSE